MQYNLGDKIMEGGEGTVYKLQGSADRVVKIYHDKDQDGNPVMTPELYEKLKWMVKNKPQKLIAEGILAWPLDLYFGNSKNTDYNSFQGFVMPFLKFDSSLENAYTYKHPVVDSGDRGYAKSLSVLERLEVAIDLCRVFGELQQSGIVIGDFNKDNVGVRAKERKIVLMDCDSFHLVEQMKDSKFRCNRAMPGYLAPEIMELSADAKTKGQPFELDKIRSNTFTKESDNFCLAVHIFHLLMNGVNPYNGIAQGIHGSSNRPFVDNEAIRRFEYVFREGKEPSSEFCPPRHSLPAEIAASFDAAFITGRKNPSRRPTPDEWIVELQAYRQNILKCNVTPKHYHYSSFKTCPYCVADMRYLERTNKKRLTLFPETFTQKMNLQQQPAPQNLQQPQGQQSSIGRRRYVSTPNPLPVPSPTPQGLFSKIVAWWGGLSGGKRVASGAGLLFSVVVAFAIFNNTFGGDDVNGIPYAGDTIAVVAQSPTNSPTTTAPPITQTPTQPANTQSQTATPQPTSAPNPTSVSLSASALTLNIGETGNLSATVLPTNTPNRNVSWSSGNVGIASVNSNGIVTAVSAGEVNITATTSNGLTASASITVNAPVAETPTQQIQAAEPTTTPEPTTPVVTPEPTTTPDPPQINLGNYEPDDDLPPPVIDLGDWEPDDDAPPVVDLGN